MLSLAQRHDIVIFEDDIYGELATDYPRPSTIKSYDIDGRVLLCSSVTKTVAPGLRVGWIAPGRYLDRVLHKNMPPSAQTYPAHSWPWQHLFVMAIITAMCAACARSTSISWKPIPVGCASISRAVSVTRPQGGLSAVG